MCCVRDARAASLAALVCCVARPRARRTDLCITALSCIVRALRSADAIPRVCAAAHELKSRQSSRQASRPRGPISQVPPCSRSRGASRYPLTTRYKMLRKFAPRALADVRGHGHRAAVVNVSMTCLLTSCNSAHRWSEGAAARHRVLRRNKLVYCPDLILLVRLHHLHHPRH